MRTRRWTWSVLERPTLVGHGFFYELNKLIGSLEDMTGRAGSDSLRYTIVLIRFMPD